MIKPDIVFYGDEIKEDVAKAIEKEVDSCDLLLIMGTSLSTYPVSSWIQLFTEKDIVL